MGGLLISQELSPCSQRTRQHWLKIHLVCESISYGKSFVRVPSRRPLTPPPNPFPKHPEALAAMEDVRQKEAKLEAEHRGA